MLYSHLDRYTRPIMNILIISVREIMIEAQGMNLAGTEIMLIGENGTRLTARFSNNSRSYLLSGNQMLIPGVGYRVVSQSFQVPPNQSFIAIPSLILAKQTGPNQIEIVYNRPADLRSALTITNYWIRVNRPNPDGFGTVGMGEQLTAQNSLKPGMAAIRAIDQSKMRFLISVNRNASRGLIYEVQPCFVNEEGRSGYTGENWTSESNNRFTGR